MTGFKNIDSFKKRLKKRLGKDATGNIKSAMFRSTKVVQSKAISSVSMPGAGRDRGDGTRASAPGQPPATDSGVLRNGITTDLVVEQDALVGQIIAYAPANGGNYAIHLEFGTRYMDARPFMQPALRQSAKKVKNIFKKEGIIR